MSNSAIPFALLANAIWVILTCVVCYILLAFGLSMLGARARQRSTWLAWLPVLNFYLMCRLAQAPLLLFLPALIPGLNFLVFAYLGNRMAKRFGRSGKLGACFGVPVLGNIVPLILALGRKTEAEQAAPAPAQPPLVTAMIHTGVVFTLLALPIAGWLTAKHFSRDTTPAPTVQQAAAALPTRVAGSMTEFPIDSATTNKATPSDLSAATFALPTPGEKQTIGVNQEKLPPWIKAESIATLAESAATADYNSATTQEPVQVVSLALRSNSGDDPKPPTPEELAAIDPAATAKGVELQSADNVTYRGFKVNTPQSVYYALHRSDTNSLVLISAKDTAGVPVAERLAANLGNGRGLMDDELGRGATARLAQAPPGTRLTRLETATVAQIDAVVARMNDKQLWAKFDEDHKASEAARIANTVAMRKEMGESSEEIAQYVKLEEQAGAMSMTAMKTLMPLCKAMMPRAYTVAFFSKTAAREEEYGASVAGFPSSSDAWTALEAAQTALKFIETFAGGGFNVHSRSIELGGYSGIVIEKETEEGAKIENTLKTRYAVAIILREGSYLRTYFSSQTDTKISADEMRPWVESQLARH